MAHHGTNSDNSHTLTEKAIEADYVEQQTSNGTGGTAPAQKRGFGSKLKRHCARFWWIHLLVFCIAFLIIALCLVYVALPRIAQHDVDRSRLELLDLKFLDPTANSFNITQKAILHNPSKFTPTLDGFPAETYFVHNDTGFGPEPMVILQMPKIHAKHPRSNATVAPQIATVINMDEVNAYIRGTLTQEWVATALVGKTDLHLGALPTNEVDYNTTVIYRGLNGLAGFNVTSPLLNLTAINNGIVPLTGNAFIPNPSVITVAMGNLTLDLATEKEGIVGEARIEEFTLQPGDNNFPMTATLNQTKVLSSMDTATGIVTLLITGRESIYNGVHLTYYEQALSSNVLHLNMNVLQIVRDSQAAH